MLGQRVERWGRLYVQDLRVKEEVCSCFFCFVLLDALSFCIYIWFRRRGVGSWLLQKMLSLSLMGYRGHAFCWPAPIGPAVYRRHVIRFGRRGGYSSQREIPLNPQYRARYLDKTSSSFSDYLPSSNTSSRRTPADLAHLPAYA